MASIVMLHTNEDGIDGIVECLVEDHGAVEESGLNWKVVSPNKLRLNVIATDTGELRSVTVNDKTISNELAMFVLPRAAGEGNEHTDPMYL